MINRFPCILIILLGACTPNANLPQGRYYAPRSMDLNMRFPGQTNDKLEYDQFGGLTKRTFRRHLGKVAAGQDDKLLYFSHIIDYPGKTPYTTLGKLVANVDTVKLKSQGFVNWKTNNQPYLKKVYDDRGRRMVTAEYIVPVDSGYFYMLGYAPTRHLQHNYEDVIIAQDSINRKSSAIIGSFRSR